MRILVVEDNKRLADAVAKGLRENSFAVDISGDGEDALYQAEINDYDLLVLDIMIPAPDGLEVCRQLREKKFQMPILMLSARGKTGDKIKGLDTGADDYLAKPFEFSELLARIRALLRRKDSKIVSANIEIADLIIETNSQRVWRGGKQISLSAKEFCLLEFMAREKGVVLGRAEIAEHCWDANFDAFSNIIDVYIKRLRKKVDEDFSTKLIHTKRGAGYILDDNI